jgi:hypothetical protein
MASAATMKKLTPVLIAGEIEPCLQFWSRLGFERTAEVPGESGGKLAFVSLDKNGVEVMYQSRASVEKDLPALAAMPSSAVFYVEVDDLDAVIRSLGDAPQVFARRRTFYGSDEIGVREPAGNVVIFSRQGAPAA